MEQVIDYIKKLREKADLLETSVFATCGLVQDYRNCARIIEKLSEQPQADKWITCEERLPSEKGFYQVTCEWAGQLEVYDLWYGDNEWMLDEDEGEVLQKVIAWMPLPQPYKKEGEE